MTGRGNIGRAIAGADWQLISGANNDEHEALTPTKKMQRAWGHGTRFAGVAPGVPQRHWWRHHGRLLGPRPPTVAGSSPGSALIVIQRGTDRSVGDREGDPKSVHRVVQRRRTVVAQRACSRGAARRWSSRSAGARGGARRSPQPRREGRPAKKAMRAGELSEDEEHRRNGNLQKLTIGSSTTSTVADRKEAEIWRSDGAGAGGRHFAIIADGKPTWAASGAAVWPATSGHRGRTSRGAPGQDAASRRERLHLSTENGRVR